jgi:hypothetical protein
MTREEFLAAMAEHYDALHKLESSVNFYEHEKNFDKIWTEAGAGILEKTLGKLPTDKREKKKFVPDTEKFL